MNAATIGERLREVLAGEPEVLAAWLFGSTARGTDRASSDVDVAILTRRPMRGTLDDLHLDVRERLTAALGREVDLVVLDVRDDELVHRVLRDGVLLRDDDRPARVAFEVAARNRFFDMIPIRRQYRRAREAT
jgi:predicted nucleotidyltransferase